MKSIFLFLVFTVFTNLLLSQNVEDQQWLIRNGLWKDGVETSNSQLNNYVLGNGNFTVDISDPDPSVDSSSNFFFGISTEGDYGFYTQGPDFQSPTIEGRINNNPIKYLYLTNIYEDDDPPPDVKLVSSGDLPNSFLSSLRVTNQDIIDRTDVTVIIDESYFEDAVDDYTLCYEVENGMSNSLELLAQGFDGSNRNYLYKSPTSGLVSNRRTFSNSSQKCLNFVKGEGNVFFNFRANIIDDNVIGKSVIFTVKYIDSDGENKVLPLQDKDRNMLIPISGKYHDPNFIRVDCVWSENEENYAAFHIECFNSENAAVNDLEMSFLMPDAISDLSTVNITNWQFGCTSGCGEGDDKVSILTTGSNELKFKFNSGKLAANINDEDPKKKHIAWIEFCVQLDSNLSEGIETVALQPSAPHTLFGLSPFPIVAFIDDFECSDPSPNNDECSSVSRVRIEKCKNCNCPEEKVGVFQFIKDLFN